MLNAYDPPSPPLSALLPPPTHSVGKHSNEQSNNDNYEDSREQVDRRPERLPEPQGLQQQSQSPQEYKQTPYGVEVEFDQNQKNEPTVVRGPGVYNRHQGPAEGYNSDSDDDQRRPDERPHGYGREPAERPNYSSDNSNDNSYDNNGSGEQMDYENHNHLGPKYNMNDNDGKGQGVYREKERNQLIKPQEIEYGFIPLNEMNNINSGGNRGYGGQGKEGFRNGRGRPDEVYGPEGYREQNRGYNGNAGHRPQRPQKPFNGQPEYNGAEGVGIVYNRGQSQAGYDGNDIYREPTVQQMAPTPNGYRKPSFDRPPPYMNNGGQEENAGYGGGYGQNVAKPQNEEEEVDNDDIDYGKQNNKTISLDNSADELGPNDPNKIPFECYPWNCNPWHAVHPNSPYNSVGAALKGRGPHSSGLPPGASYNPRDVGLDESVIAQLNLAASTPVGASPPVVAAPGLVPHGNRQNLYVHGGPGMEMPYSPGRPFPYNNVASGMPVHRPRPRPQPYSASGQGFRSQYGYRAAASELSPVSSAQTSQPAGGTNSPVLSNLLNLNPVKSFRSLMTYITGGING